MTENVVLCTDADGVFLKILGKGMPGSIRVDFTDAQSTYRRQSGGGVKQAIAKAVGIKHGKRPTILDVTAGLGRDAFVLASLGCEVTLVERSPVIVALLKDGLKRAAEDPKVQPITQRMQLIQADSITYMQSLRLEQRPDVVYLDPMFPERKKSAKVKKEMAVLQALLADVPQNNDALLATALSCAKKRVVVKRPRLAPPVSHKPPQCIISGKTCRFDVYTI